MTSASYLTWPLSTSGCAEAEDPSTGPREEHRVAARADRALLGGNPEKDKAAAFYWQILPDLWLYAANRIGEISDSVADIDRAMRTGFNWELGPFEMWDAAGVSETASKMRAQGRTLPAAWKSCWPQADRPGTDTMARHISIRDRGNTCRSNRASAVVTLTRAKRSGGVVAENPGASLIDVGDGIGCIEFHTKMNALGGDIVDFVAQDAASRQRRCAQFPRLCDHQRRCELLRGRESRPVTAGRAGRRVGRNRHLHSRIPGDDAGDQVLPLPGGRRAVWTGVRRRRGSDAAPRLCVSRTSNCTWDWSKPGRAHSCGRRLQGDDPARPRNRHRCRTHSIAQ